MPVRDSPPDAPDDEHPSSRGRLRPATDRRCRRPIARRDGSRRSGRRGGARRFPSDGCVPVERRERGPDQFSNDAAVESLARRSNGGELFDHEERAIEGYFTTTGARTLDLGCGAGRVTTVLADRGLDVTGVDRSGAQLRTARALLPSVPFVESDAADLPFPTDAFRYVVFAYNGLDYLIPRESREAALREVRRVLDPSGVFLFSSHNLWYTLPALVLDRGHVVDKFLRTRNLDRLFDRYKYEDAAAGDLETFFSDPHMVRRELRNAGFELVDIVGNRRFPASLLEWSPYYVAAPV